MDRVRFARAFAIAVVMFAIGLWVGTSAAQTARQDFDKYCAGCHGPGGKGNGTEGYVMPPTPMPDLTQLAKRNGGVFPLGQVVDVIDGRKNIPSHARIQMPFWGVVMQKEGKEFTPESDAEVQRRITALAKYIESLQEK
jgi:mono/diheme cytochrome c family protein